MCDEWEVLDKESWWGGLSIMWMFEGDAERDAHEVSFYPIWEDLFRAAYVMARRAIEAAKRAKDLRGLDRLKEEVTEIRFAGPAIPLAAASLEAYINACVELARKQGYIDYKTPEEHKGLLLAEKTVKFGLDLISDQIFSLFPDEEEEGEQYWRERIVNLCKGRNRVMHSWCRPVVSELLRRARAVPPEQRTDKFLESVKEQVLRERVESVRRLGIGAKEAAEACDLVGEIAQRILSFGDGMPHFFGEHGPPGMYSWDELLEDLLHTDTAGNSQANDGYR